MIEHLIFKLKCLNVWTSLAYLTDLNIRTFIVYAVSYVIVLCVFITTYAVTYICTQCTGCQICLRPNLQQNCEIAETFHYDFRNPHKILDQKTCFQQLIWKHAMGTDTDKTWFSIFFKISKLVWRWVKTY